MYKDNTAARDPYRVGKKKTFCEDKITIPKHKFSKYAVITALMVVVAFLHGLVLGILIGRDR